jgi:hypothetical protein
MSKVSVFVNVKKKMRMMMMIMVIGMDKKQSGYDKLTNDLHGM